MQTAVFIWPLKMIPALYADLVEGSTTAGGFLLEHSAVGENQEPGDKLTIKFNFASPLTQSGRICLEASGKRVSGFEAERTALLSMLEKLRTEYGILNADYSYVVVARKRVLFEAMRNATTSLSRAYCMVDEAVVCSSIAVHKCATALTDWLSLHEHHLDRSTITAVSSFHEWAISSISSLSAAANGTSSVVRAMMERELGPEPMVRMFETSPMPMMVNWHASYFMLRTVFDSAVNHVSGRVSKIQVSRCEGAMFKANAQVSFCNDRFIGDQSNTKNGAKAKLMFTILDYMEHVLGCRIMDANHVVKEYMEDHIAQYNHRTELLTQCANRLKRLFDTFHLHFGGKKSELTQNISKDGCPVDLANIINVCAQDLQGAASKLVQSLTDFDNLKAQSSRDAIERSTPSGP